MSTVRYNLRRGRKNAVAPAGEPAAAASAPAGEEKFNPDAFLKMLGEKYPTKQKKNRVPVEESESSDYETIDSVEEEELSDSGSESSTEAGKPQMSIFVMDGGSDDDSDYDPDSPTEKYLHLVNRRQTSERKFLKSLTTEEQKEIIAKVENIGGFASDPVPQRVALIRSKMPDEYKSIALKKMSALRTAHDGEAHKLQHWITTFMDVPFNVTTPLPVSIADGIEACQLFMVDTKRKLDDAVFGLDDAKLQIMQWLGTVISNPNSQGTAIGIKGPMGTGKTTLVKKGICEALKCPFVFISLGGATDSSVLEGHHPTYEGSVCGGIVQALIECRCMDPVFFFDELDKVSDTPKGKEITDLLIHLIDASQNDKFQDKFFNGIYFNLSKAKFIFSFNDEQKVDPILRDRMYMIQTEGYTLPEKLEIARKFIVERIRNNVGLKEDMVLLPDETITFAIEHYTGGEKGVRNLIRCLESVFHKINLKRFLPPDTKLFKNKLDFDIAFPLTVTPALVAKLLKRDEPSANMSMYL